jgi:hypothetical protein
MQTNYECQIRCNDSFSQEERKKKRRRRITSFPLLKKWRRNRQRNPGLVAAAVHAATAVVTGLVVSAGSVVGVIVEGVPANLRVVTVGKEFLHFPVVGSLANGELEIFLSNSIPELDEC